MKKIFTLHTLHSTIVAILVMLLCLVSAPAAAHASSKVLGEPELTLSAKSFLKARGQVGQKVLVATITVDAVDQPNPIVFAPTGAIENIFTTDVTTIPAGTSQTTVNIYYEAPAVAKHKGNIYLMSGDDMLESIRLEGMATDPANPAALDIAPASFKELAAEKGATVRDTLLVTPKGTPDFVKVAIAQTKPGFSCNTTILATTGEQRLVVTFSPKEVGDYDATITLSNEFIAPVVLSVKGTCTEKVVAPTKEGDELPLSMAQPLTLLNETFTTVTHNKPLQLQGWKNLAQEGMRAWWGYDFPSYDADNAGEHAAKVTAFDSQVADGEETPCEMLLVTPALDFVNSASKLFTFRVMGNNLTDKMTETLELCYIYADADGTMHVEPVGGIDFPKMADLNGEWKEFHVDLTGQNIDDVFFMGFRYKAQRGRTSSVIYYIDDVTYGRTDVPLITPSVTELTIEADVKKDAVSEVVTVEVENLTNPIALKLGGKDKDKFKLSLESLPSTGGLFAVKFNAAAGNYEAYVKLSSKGAADKYVLLYATAATGLQTVMVSEQDYVVVYDTMGRSLRTARGVSLSDALRTLPTGTYLVQVSGASGTTTLKLHK